MASVRFVPRVVGATSAIALVRAAMDARRRNASR